MNLLGRLLYALIDEPVDYGEDHEDHKDNETNNLQTVEDRPGLICRWIEVTVRCRAPLDDGNNLPSGCDANCPARLAMEKRAYEREKEAQRLYF